MPAPVDPPGGFLHGAPARPGREAGCAGSEGVPGRLPGVFQVSDVGADAQANSRPDRRDHHVVALLERDADAAHEIGKARNAREALVDLVWRAQVVDQHHDLGAFRPGIPADRRPLPVDAVLPGILRIKHALAIAQAGDERPAGVLPENVAVGPALVLERVFDDVRQPLADRAEEVVARIEDLAARERLFVGIIFPVARRRRGLLVGRRRRVGLTIARRRGRGLRRRIGIAVACRWRIGSGAAAGRRAIGIVARQRPNRVVERPAIRIVLGRTVGVVARIGLRGRRARKPGKGEAGGKDGSQHGNAVGHGLTHRFKSTGAPRGAARAKARPLMSGHGVRGRIHRSNLSLKRLLKCGRKLRARGQEPEKGHGERRRGIGVRPHATKSGLRNLAWWLP